MRLSHSLIGGASPLLATGMKKKAKKAKKMRKKKKEPEFGVEEPSLLERYNKKWQEELDGLKESS